MAFKASFKSSAFEDFEGFFMSVKLRKIVRTRGTSIIGEVHNVEIPGPTQQLLCSKYHDYLAVFSLAHPKINQIA